MKTKNVKGLIFNTAFIFAPALICIALFKSENQFSYIVDKLGVKYIQISIPLFLMIITIILFRFSIKYTASNLIRFLVIILSALISFLSIINFGPGGACNGPGTIAFFLLPLFLVYLICTLIVIMFFLKDSNPRAKKMNRRRL